MLALKSPVLLTTTLRARDAAPLPQQLVTASARPKSMRGMLDTLWNQLGVSPTLHDAGSRWSLNTDACVHGIIPASSRVHVHPPK